MATETSIKDLMAQKEELERLIAEATAHGKNEAIAQVKALMEEYGLTVADLGSRGAKTRTGAPRSTGMKVGAKYRDSTTGESWSGRGLQPRWLKAAVAGGKKLEDFAV